MSYILEALKKADRERMVGHVPDLEVVHAVSPQPRRLNRWYWLLGALLVINGVLVAGLALRDGDVGAPGGEVAATAGALAPAPVPAPAPAPERTAMAPAVVPPVSAPARAAPAPRELPWKAYYQPPARQKAAAPDPPPETAPDTVPAARGGGNVVYMDAPLGAEPGPAADGPADKPAASLPVLGATGRASKQTTERSESVLPDWDDLPLEFRSSFQVPHIDVHVYDTDPAQRFILVNLIKYRPGDRLESGALLEQITPDGVQLLFRGKRFIYRP